jgi:heme A synthase
MKFQNHKMWKFYYDVCFHWKPPYDNKLMSLEAHKRLGMKFIHSFIHLLLAFFLMYKKIIMYLCATTLQGVIGGQVANALRARTCIAYLLLVHVTTVSELVCRCKLHKACCVYLGSEISPDDHWVHTCYEIRHIKVTNKL